MLRIWLTGMLLVSVAPVRPAQAQYYSNNFGFSTPQGANVDMLLTHEINRRALLGASRGSTAAAPSARQAPRPATGDSYPLTATDVARVPTSSYTTRYVAGLAVPQSSWAEWIAVLNQTVDQLEADSTNRPYNVAYALAGMYLRAMEVLNGQRSSATQRAVFARSVNEGLADSPLTSMTLAQKQLVYQTAVLTQATLIVLATRPSTDPDAARKFAESIVAKAGVRTARGN